MINAHDLLVTGDDAGLNRCDPLRIRERSGVRNFCPAQTRAESSTSLVIPNLFLRSFLAANDSKHLDLRPERSQIGCHISRSAETIGLRSKIHHRDRCFRRKAVRIAPEIAVKHEIAQHGHADLLESWQEALQSR